MVDWACFLATRNEIMARAKLFFWGLYVANKTDADTNATEDEQVGTAHEPVSNDL